MQHQELNSEKWSKLSLGEQMANVGMEISRALKWKNKNNLNYANLANIRALELIDLTINDPSNLHRINEITRMRELWLDFFIGDNMYKQTEQMWEKYFYAFNYQASINKFI